MTKPLITVFFLLTTLLWVSCSKTPSWVLPENKMEVLLFDLHLAESQIEHRYGQFTDSTQKQALFDAVFEKHRTTKQKFDTSLVWYSAHLDLFVAIYERITTKYNSLADTLEAHIRIQTELEARARIVYSVDSLVCLRPYVPHTKFLLRIDSSEYFGVGDMYELSGNLLGVSADFQPRVVLTWNGSDTTVVQHRRIKQNGHFAVYVKAIPGYQTKSIQGNITVRPNEANKVLLIEGLHVKRHRQGYHPEIPEVEELEEVELSSSADSIRTDSAQLKGIVLPADKDSLLGAGLLRQQRQKKKSLK